MREIVERCFALSRVSNDVFEKVLMENDEWRGVSKEFGCKKR